MPLAGRTKLRVSKIFFWGTFFVFVEYLCKRSPKTETKNIKNYSSILAIVNHRNWLDGSPPLTKKYFDIVWGATPPENPPNGPTKNQVFEQLKLEFYFGLISVDI